MGNRLLRFKEELLPFFIEKVGQDFIIFSEKDKNVRIYENRLGKRGKVLMQYYPIGNLLNVGLKWVRENAFHIFALEVFGCERPDLEKIMHPHEQPKIKPAKVSKKNRYRKATADNLSIVGERFSEENLNQKRTAAVIRMERLLRQAGIPFICEYPVVIKESLFNNGMPKLYLLDFFIPPPFKFIIEVDGGYHSTESQVKYDCHRDHAVGMKGLGPTIRVKNEAVLDSNFDLMAFLGSQEAFKEAVREYKKQLAIRKF